MNIFECYLMRSTIASGNKSVFFGRKLAEDEKPDYPEVPPQADAVSHYGSAETLRIPGTVFLVGRQGRVQFEIVREHTTVDHQQRALSIEVFAELAQRRARSVELPVLDESEADW